MNVRDWDKRFWLLPEDYRIGTENVVFCSSYNASTLFFKSPKEIFSMQKHGILLTCYQLWSTVI
jgi:hypothetical protein